jgi:hypothetical protein
VIYMTSKFHIGESDIIGRKNGDIIDRKNSR